MIIQNVKGGYDFTPKEQKIRNYINDILKETFEEYGYLPIETPILCYYDLLAGKYDENNDILKEIYKLNDQGKRNLGLRYDLTVPFAKFIALNKNTLKLPFKRYEINKVFRDGPVKVGRDREFTQCDVDVVGLSNQVIEAELLSLYVQAFSKLDIPVIIKYNSRNLMRGLITTCDIAEELISPTITIIDKMDKLSSEELLSEFNKIGLTNQQATTLQEYFILSLEELNNKFKDSNNEYIKQGLTELNELTTYIQELNLKDYCLFTPSLARGQDYYTGNVFEVYEKNGELSCAIGAGGRYDKMITDFVNDGTSYPAVGISFGLTSIFEIFKKRTLFDNKASIDLYIIPLNTTVESLRLANDIRKLSIKVDIEMTNKKVKKALDYCNKENIRYVIILGSDELTKQEFKLKDMFTKQEYTISFADLNRVKEIIAS